MKKVRILYYSGRGNTKTISEKIYANINEHFETEIFSIENIEKSFSLDKI